MSFTMMVSQQNQPVLLRKKKKKVGENLASLFQCCEISLQVVNETVRMGSILPSIFRKVDKDIEIKGTVWID